MSWMFGALFFFFSLLTFTVTIRRPAMGFVSATLGVFSGFLAMAPYPNGFDSRSFVVGGFLSLFFLLIWLWGWFRSKNT